MQGIIQTPRVRMESVVRKAKADFWPNMPKKAGERFKAPSAFQAAVNAASHMDPEIEAMKDQGVAHDMRQAIREELFAYARSI